MSERVLNNFRGSRALVLHPDDSNRDMLTKTLRRLGLFVAVAAPEPKTLLTPEFTACDVLFCDADRPLGATFGEQSVPAVPHIALIGMEAPSRLARVVRQRCCGYLLKPVRSAGVFTALFMAFNEFAVRQREASERTDLIERIHGRRHCDQGRPPLDRRGRNRRRRSLSPASSRKHAPQSPDRADCQRPG